MTFYLVAGQGTESPPASTGSHLPTNRPRRYPSDTSDIEWQLTAPHIPAGGSNTRHGGRPVSYPRRDIVDAIRYLDHNSCVWRAPPADFPPWPTVYHYFKTWTRDGTLNRMHNGLREQIRTAEGRHRDPSAALIDSQSVRAAETVDLDTTLTVVAGNLYRLLARTLPRYETATPDRIWRHFLDATGTLNVTDDTVTVDLNLRTYHPSSSTPASPTSTYPSLGGTDASSASASHPANTRPNLNSNT